MNFVSIVEDAIKKDMDQEPKGHQNSADDVKIIKSSPEFLKNFVFFIRKIAHF